jgi:hypothetical protein
MTKHFYKVSYYATHNFYSIEQEDQIELARLLEFTPGKSIELKLKKFRILRIPTIYFCVSPVKLKSDSAITKTLEQVHTGVYTLLKQDRSIVDIEICKSKKCDKVFLFMTYTGFQSWKSLVFIRKVKNIKPDLHKIVDVSGLFTPYEIVEDLL